MSYKYKRKTWKDGEIIPAEPLNNMEEGIAEAHKALEEGGVGVSVRYDMPQNLTDAQKKQAQDNMGMAAGAVRYDAAQNLTEAQKTQARENIGASAGAVRYDVGQSLSAAQKKQARENIGASDGIIPAGNVQAGTLAGKVQANAAAMAAVGQAQLRDVVLVTTDPGAGAASNYPDGTVILVYE